MLSGDVRREAPDLVRRILRAAWPNALAQRADRDESHALGELSELWRVPSEILVYRGPEDLASWRSGTADADADTMLHLLFDPDELTIVCAPKSEIAEEIVQALVANTMITRRDEAA